MKKLLLLIIATALSGCPKGDTHDNRVFNCPVEIYTDVITIDEFDQRVSEGENLSIESFGEINNEQVVTVTVCSEEQSDDDTTSPITTNTINL